MPLLITRIKFLLFAILFFAAPTAIFAAEGDLDSSFDGDGIVVTDNDNSNDSIRNLIVQPDGKIIAVGVSSEFSSSARRAVIVRYLADGTIDTSFGTNGKVSISSIFLEEAALQVNGKIVFAGRVGTSTNTDFYIARLNSDGSFDTTFNATGAIALDLRGTSDSATSVKIQSDGKIVVGGASIAPQSSSNSRNDFALIRLNADGSLDATFDGDGKVFTAIQETAGINSVAIQTDGKIVTAGEAFLTETSSGNPIGSFATVRYNADGSIDSTFNGNGMAFTQFASGGFAGGTRNNRPETVLIRDGGKILVLGTTKSCCAPQPLGQAAMIQYNPNGAVDSSFGNAGKIQVGFSTFAATSANDAAIQADNKIVIAGSTQGNIKLPLQAIVGRFNANGSLDSTFSGDGWNTLQLTGGASNTANAAAIQPDGKILIGGDKSGVSQDFIIARFAASSCTANCSGARRMTISDFDGDGKTDIAVFRPSNGFWYVSKSSGGYLFVPWGTAVDLPVPGDYDGDGKADFAVYRKSADSTWYILKSSDNAFFAKQWGATNLESQLLLRDVPMPSDYDGDGKTDLAVYRLTDAIGETGRFVVSQSSTDSRINTDLGNHFFTTVPADYDGDGRTDYAIFRNGVWSILQNPNGSLFRTEYFGLSTDRLVPADYDGDGLADIAVWRPSTGYWYWISSLDKSFHSNQFGLAEDKPVPGDYDGDGKTDYAVFRPSNGVWYLQQSTKGFRAEQFGLATDIPIPNVFVR